MTRLTRTLLAAGAAAVIVAGFAVGAQAQATDPAVTAAIASGVVGEQVDGYLGFAKAGSPDLKAKVEALNIKRRAAYTDLAAKTGVSVKDAAQATGCRTLGRLADGRAYSLGSGWQTKNGAIALSGICG